MKNTACTKGKRWKSLNSRRILKLLRIVPCNIIFIIAFMSFAGIASVLISVLGIMLSPSSEDMVISLSIAIITLGVCWVLMIGSMWLSEKISCWKIKRHVQNHPKCKEIKTKGKRWKSLKIRSNRRKWWQN